MPSIHIIGGGLAGSEAAWQAASFGVQVVLHEMRPVRGTDVHKTGGLAELVCSNSFRGDKLDNAVGLLKEEMRRLGTIIMRAADAHRVPAGAALAVDQAASVLGDDLQSEQRGRGHVYVGRAVGRLAVERDAEDLTDLARVDFERGWRVDEGAGRRSAQARQIEDPQHRAAGVDECHVGR
jgi:predicted NAD/FAD-dependent oxidoreductase